MELFYQCCEIAATTVETLVLLEFISKLLGCKYDGIMRIVLLAISFVVINGYMIFVGVVSPQYAAMSDIIVLGLYLIFSLCTTKSSVIYRIITPALCITAIMVINITVYSVVSFLFNIESGDLITQQSSFRVVSLFITKFAFFLLTRIALKFIKPTSVTLSTKEFLAIVSTFFISVIVLSLTAKVQFSIWHEDISILTAVILIGITTINIIVFVLFSMIAKKNQESLRQAMMQVQYEEQKKTYDSINTVYRDLQILQHDLKNELLCIQNFIEQGQKQKVLQYIKNLTDTKLNVFHEYVKTGSELLDAIMNMKLNYARECGIEIYCNIGVNLNGFQENDIMILFSNAIDNAIEASLMQSQKKIVITMENKRNYLCISIANAIECSVLDNNSKLQTTKKDKKHHGFGTQSMCSIVEQYDGMLEYYEKNGMFVVNIMIKHE